MTPTWKLTPWGVRGSLPAPDAACLGYGGHTACFSLDCGDAHIILDAGSGLIPLGERLLEGNRLRADLLLSHLHLDHILGLYTFPLLRAPEAQVHLYAPPDLLNSLTRLIGPPLWPVGLADGAADVFFHPIAPESPFQIEAGKTPLTVTPPWRGTTPEAAPTTALKPQAAAQSMPWTAS